MDVLDQGDCSPDGPRTRRMNASTGPRIFTPEELERIHRDVDAGSLDAPYPAAPGLPRLLHASRRRRRR